MSSPQGGKIPGREMAQIKLTSIPGLQQRAGTYISWLLRFPWENPFLHPLLSCELFSHYYHYGYSNFPYSKKRSVLKLVYQFRGEKCSLIYLIVNFPLNIFHLYLLTFLCHMGPSPNLPYCHLECRILQYCQQVGSLTISEGMFKGEHAGFLFHFESQAQYISSISVYIRKTTSSSNLCFRVWNPFYSCTLSCTCFNDPLLGYFYVKFSSDFKIIHEADTP